LCFQRLITANKRFLFRKVESVGFSSANITSAELNASDKTYNISIALPDLFVKGMYSLVGTHHYFYPVVGAGPFDIKLFDVSTTGITTLVLIGALNFISYL